MEAEALAAANDVREQGRERLGAVMAANKLAGDGGRVPEMAGDGEGVPKMAGDHGGRWRPWRRAATPPS